MTNIDFKITPKITYITSDTPDYEDFKSNWEEWHDADEPCPADNSSKYWDAVNEEQSREWENFCDNFNHGELIGKTCLFRGRYSSRYPDFQPSCDAGRVIRIDSIDDFMKFTGDHPDNVDIWTDKEGLHVQNAHHDGTLSLVVKTLTKKGEEYWERMCRKGEGQSRECHRHLDESKGLSSPIDYYLY